MTHESTLIMAEAVQPHLAHAPCARIHDVDLIIMPRPPASPTLGPGDKIAEGDCEIVLDILPPDLARDAFESMRKEVAWNVMHHRGMSGSSSRQHSCNGAPVSRR